VPIGEGWTRHSAELLVHVPSQVFFGQRGDKKGKYLVRSGKEFSVCPAPNVATDFPIEVRASAASVLRVDAVQGQGRADDRKLERAVVIAEMPKTALRALRFPLGFLDAPAAAYALFAGTRGSSAAHWCASQFHQRLLPEIAKRIHGWWDLEGEMPEELLYRGSHVGSLAKLLRENLEGLDRDLLAGPHAFSGCDAAIAVLVGESLVVATAGQASVTLLFEDAEAVPLIAATPEDGVPLTRPTREHVYEGALMGLDGSLRRAMSVWDYDGSGSSANSAEAVSRILRAPDAFAVLGLPPSATTPTEARTAYKRLALKVHPDKVRDCDAGDAKAAFERLETAARLVEAIAEHKGEACKELHRVLRCDALTTSGATSLLMVEPDAEAHQLKNAVAKVKEGLMKAQVCGDSEVERLVHQAVESCRVAAETLRNAQQWGAPGALGERLSGEAVPTRSLRGLGLRDLRVIGAKPLLRTVSWRIGEALRVALCCGATAELQCSDLEDSAKMFVWQPKASAREWATRALSLPGRTDSSASALCICARDRLDDEDDDGRPLKRLKTGPKSVRVRHLLLRCAEVGKMLLEDPMARRRRGLLPSRSPAEAEAELVNMLKQLLGSRGDTDQDRLVSFRKLCQQHSECSTADNAGQLCGDFGWISRGQSEAAFDAAVFGLRVGDFSDVVTTSRGMHIIQRLA